MKSLALFQTLAAFLLGIGYSTTTFCQDFSNPEIFNAFPEDKRIVLFADEFDDNRNNWTLGIKENVWFQNLQEGTLVFQSYEDVAKEDFKDVIIDPNQDFEVELKIRLDKGIQNKFNGLQWGKSVTNKQQFNFSFNGQGQYTIDKFDGVQFVDFVPVTASKLINNYTYNTLTVRKVAQRYYFFLNGTLVHSMPFEPLFGHGVGFLVAGKSAVQIDYLKVWQLGNKTTFALPELVFSQKQLASASGVIAAGETAKLIFSVKNSSNQDANNIKLLYELPENIIVLESTRELQLKQNEEKDVELSFYINKEFETSQFDVAIRVEGAQLQADGQSVFEVKLNEKVESGEVELEQEYAFYRSLDPLKGLKATKAMQEVTVGRYFALIIGIDKYSGAWKPLRNAVNDAGAVLTQLQGDYEFHTVRTLFNEQGTRAGILKEFEWLMANVKENDNVLIFYSGHGDYNETLQRGFWVPADAKSSSVGELISNTDIQAFLAGIKSKHTFLIADACFSGDIFRGKTLTIPYENSFKYYNQIYSKPSRTALTSGGLEPVMDGGKEGHSIFAYYLLKSLKNNSNQFFDASQLYNDLKVAVINNSNQTPGFSPVVNTGDEGGQFIFIKKQK